MRALFVDHDDLLRRALKRSLAGSNVEIDEVSTVSAAMEALRRVDYDVIISDEEMRDGRGHDLLKHVQQLRPSCKRALISGRTTQAGAEAAGCERFFAKPDQMTALVRWLNDLAASPDLNGRSGPGDA